MNKIKSSFIKVITVVLTCLLSISINAKEKSFNNYTVHYSVLNSTFLQPNIAAKYGIPRGKREGVLNISVQKTYDNSTKPVSAILNGKVIDLIRQKNLSFKKVEEGQAIYYLAPFSFSNKEKLRFAIEVQPDPNQAPFQLNFEHTLHEG